MRVRQDEVTWREIDGDVVILDLAASAYLTTNQTGALLLQALVEERSHDDLVAVLVEAYEVTEDQASTDVRAFTAMLGEHDLLDGPPRPESHPCTTHRTNEDIT